MQHTNPPFDKKMQSLLSDYAENGQVQPILDSVTQEDQPTDAEKYTLVEWGTYLAQWPCFDKKIFERRLSAQQMAVLLDALSSNNPTLVQGLFYPPGVERPIIDKCIRVILDYGWDRQAGIIELALKHGVVPSQTSIDDARARIAHLPYDYSPRANAAEELYQVIRLLQSAMHNKCL